MSAGTPGLGAAERPDTQHAVEILRCKTLGNPVAPAMELIPNR